MISFDRVSVRYRHGQPPALHDLDLHVPEGELCLVVGPTGTGKSTLLGAVNGLVPHFTGGVLSGRVTVAGRDTRTHRPRDLADVVGMVLQDPGAGFVTDTVEDELAYTMESIGTPPPVMRRRVEETLDLLGLARLRRQPLGGLSAGERQRVAIGAALTADPRALVLDEPTSALDPLAAEEVLAVLARLVHDLGLTVLMAEHRLERVLQFADRLVYLPGRGQPAVVGEPADVVPAIPAVPAVVGLGRVAGWSPPPLSVREARRRAPALRARLAALPHPEDVIRRPDQEPAPLLRAKDLVVLYDGLPALAGVDLSASAGEVVALMGRNGAGKTTLLHCLVGLRRPDRGLVTVAGEPVLGRPPRETVRRIGLVPHQPGDLLYADSVAEECAGADRDLGLATGTTRSVLDTLDDRLPPGQHPGDLSEGQRLTLALAVVLAGEPPVLLLDEPTRGLDYAAKARLSTLLRSAAAAGRLVVMATHDVELAADVATRTVVMAEGEVVADGPTRAVVTASPAFAPQVAKVLAPLPWLTVGEVRRALA